MAPIPDGPLGESILRGQATFLNTSDSLADHVGNDLSCGSCHLDGGTRSNAAPMYGVYGRFPQYRGREDKIFSIEDRINGCMIRSMNGTKLELSDPRLRDMVAFMALPLQGHSRRCFSSWTGLAAARGTLGRHHQGCRDLGEGMRPMPWPRRPGYTSRASHMGREVLQHRRRDGADQDSGWLHLAEHAVRHTGHPNRGTGSRRGGLPGVAASTRFPWEGQ